eukprot:COSAG02_NODE_1327_length_13220_cov_11.602241_10_plen_87_part_00
MEQMVQLRVDVAFGHDQPIEESRRHRPTTTGTSTSCSWCVKCTQARPQPRRCEQHNEHGVCWTATATGENACSRDNRPSGTATGMH